MSARTVVCVSTASLLPAHVIGDMDSWHVVVMFPFRKLCFTHTASYLLLQCCCHRVSGDLGHYGEEEVFNSTEGGVTKGPGMCQSEEGDYAIRFCSSSPKGLHCQCK